MGPIRSIWGALHRERKQCFGGHLGIPWVGNDQKQREAY